MIINTNRLTYTYIEFDLTRRCNLQCPHCFRGDAQDIDMSRDVIDAFFEHTQAIYHLLFSGGEPTLYIDGMRYVLDAAKRNNVLIAFMEFPTNGIVKNQQIIDIVKDYYDYTKKFMKPDCEQKTIKIEISYDKYHDTDAEDAYQWYCDNLSDYADIGYNTRGQNPVKIGRAINLDSAIPPMEHDWKIMLKSATDESKCPRKDNQPILYPKQVIVLCGICLSVHGNFVNREYSWDEQDTNKAVNICSVFVDSAQDIVDAIVKWNEDKVYCFEVKKIIEEELNRKERQKMYAESILLSVKRLFDYIYKR